MSSSDDEPIPPEGLSASLVEELDDLGPSALREVRGYVERRLDHSRTPIAEQIRSDTGDDVVGIEDHGAYTLVRKHPPETRESSSDDRPIALYSVRRDPRPRGEESLHWSYLGDVVNTDDNGRNDGPAGDPGSGR